jgi:hypothetical protein
MCRCERKRDGSNVNRSELLVTSSHQFGALRKSPRLLSGLARWPDPSFMREARVEGLISLALTLFVFPWWQPGLNYIPQYPTLLTLFAERGTRGRSVGVDYDRWMVLIFITRSAVCEEERRGALEGLPVAALLLVGDSTDELTGDGARGSDAASSIACPDRRSCWGVG